MPPRPSRNLDRVLLAAGRELFATRGCAGLSVREVADAAGVNLGMFHYHFKTREAFLRALLQGVYEEMYSQLTVAGAQAAGARSALDRLRAALRFMGRFVRTNRPMLSRVLADALCHEPIALQFARENFPRHLGVIHALVAAAQESGEMLKIPIPQAIGFCAGSLATPILFGGAVLDTGALGKPQAMMLEAVLLSDEALDQRIDLALAALAAPAAAKPKAPRAKRPSRQGATK